MTANKYKTGYTGDVIGRYSGCSKSGVRWTTVMFTNEQSGHLEIGNCFVWPVCRVLYYVSLKASFLHFELELKNCGSDNKLL